jgi:hypothetical protein
VKRSRLAAKKPTKGNGTANYTAYGSDGNNMLLNGAMSVSMSSDDGRMQTSSEFDEDDLAAASSVSDVTEQTEQTKLPGRRFRSAYNLFVQQVLLLCIRTVIVYFVRTQ